MNNFNKTILNLEWIRLLDSEQKEFVKRIEMLLSSIYELDNDLLYKKSNALLSALFDDKNQLFEQELEICLDDRLEEILLFISSNSTNQSSNLLEELKLLFLSLIPAPVKIESAELVSISELIILEKIKNHCEQRQRKKSHNPFSCCLGMLGEAAVKKYLKDTLDVNDDKSDVLSPINFKLYDKTGDGKRDFFSQLFYEFGVQVKTTRIETSKGNINNLEWSISQDEVNKNQVLVCVFAFQKFDRCQVNSLQLSGKKQASLSKSDSGASLALQNYLQNHNELCIAGFLPVNMIEERASSKIEDGKYVLNLKNLLYCGGLISYLLHPDISSYSENSTDPESCRIIGEFYCHCGLYEKALNKYNYILSINSNMYEIYSDRSACYIMLENDKYHARFKTRFLGESHQETLAQQIGAHLQQKKPVPLIPKLLVNEIYNKLINENLDLECDLESFINDEVKRIYDELNKKYPVSSVQPCRKTYRHSVSYNKLYWQAVKDASKAITIYPEYIPAYINKGLAYKYLAQDTRTERAVTQLCEKAIENYSLAIEISNLSIDVNKPLSAFAYYYRGLAYIYCCRIAERLEDKADYSKASEDCIQAAKLFNELGWVSNAEVAIFQIDIHIPF